MVTSLHSAEMVGLDRRWESRSEFRSQTCKSDKSDQTKLQETKATNDQTSYCERTHLMDTCPTIEMAALCHDRITGGVKTDVAIELSSSFWFEPHGLVSR